MPDDLPHSDSAARLARLEGKLEALSFDLNRLAKVNFDSHVQFDKHLHIIERELSDAFGRIKNLELTVFPNLAHDITQLRDVIGKGEDTSENPLDRRPK